MALAFLCCHYIFVIYATYLTLTCNNICVFPLILIFSVFIVILWLWPFYVVIISFSYMLAIWLLLTFNNICVFPLILIFLCLYLWTVIISVVFKSVSSQCRCYLKPKYFFRRNFAGVSEHPQNPQLGRNAHFSVDYIHYWHHVW